MIIGFGLQSKIVQGMEERVEDAEEVKERKDRLDINVRDGVLSIPSFASSTSFASSASPPNSIDSYFFGSSATPAGLRTTSL
jgi:hypothetical protein